MFLLFGSTTTQSDAHASTASRICAVDGFIDWPPATTRCTPRLVSRRSHAVTDADRDHRGGDGAAGCGALVVRSATTSASRTQRSSSTCSIRSVMRMLCGRPASMPASTAAPMSLVWTWQFQMPSPPTTTIESPIAAHASRNPGIVSSSRVEQVHDLVTQRRDVVAREVRATLGGVSTSSGSGIGRPSTTSRNASMRSVSPLPPASTTPASRRTGRRSGVRGDGVAARLGRAFEQRDERRRVERLGRLRDRRGRR